jgi:hypothetical protein
LERLIPTNRKGLHLTKTKQKDPGQKPGFFLRHKTKLRKNSKKTDPLKRALNSLDIVSQLRLITIYKEEKALENIPGTPQNKHLTHTNKPQTNTHTKKTWKQWIYDPGLLNHPRFLFLLSCVIFLINLGGGGWGGFWRVGCQDMRVFPQVKGGVQHFCLLQPYI